MTAHANLARPTRTKFRAVSPAGELSPWRRSLGNAIRDAVYEVKGWGKDIDGVTIRIDGRVALTMSNEVIAAGWTFQKVTQR